MVVSAELVELIEMLGETRATEILRAAVAEQHQARSEFAAVAAAHPGTLDNAGDWAGFSATGDHA